MITNTDLEKQGNRFPNQIQSQKKESNKLYFSTDNNIILELTVLQDKMIRFRYGTRGKFEDDFSYAISKKMNSNYNHLEVKNETDFYLVITEKLVIKIEIAGLQTKIFNTDGELINEDELGFHYEENYLSGNNIVKMSKKTQLKEAFYALGDKPMHANLRGNRVENWVTDQYAFEKDQDPIYKSIPFYIGLHHNNAYGIFFDNTFRSYFDFCNSRQNVTSFWADGGEMDYYFFYGPEMKEVVSMYSDLTGKAELPPLWALGYHQCRWSYYPESEFRGIANKFRELEIPCDAIYLDIDYMDGFRCFTWNKDYFPDPKKMISDLADNGFKTIVIIDPGIKVDPEYQVYNQALEKDYFCKRADGPLMLGKVWPGECNFPDFTNSEVRKWWSHLFKGLIAEDGVKGIWNDMNEPAVMEVPNKTFADDVRHDYDGHPCSHRKAHNIYGMQMMRATFNGVKKYAYPKRPFVITRSAYSGAQRYGCTWTGDNVASWEHLRLANIQVQRLCLSGMSFAGTDIGGFAEQPTGELYARWIQLGVFHPFCRTHSSGDHGDQEPWSFDDNVTDVSRKFIEIRYQLLPYLYSAFYEYCEEGIPIIKPLYYFDQEDPLTHSRTDEFIFGNHILVCPIVKANAKGRRMYFPRGRWYDFWTNEVFYGGKEQWVDADINSMPIFIKAGAIIPRFAVQQYVGEKKIEELKLDIYYKSGVENSVIYEDAQDTYDYEEGEYSLRNFKLIGKESELIIQQFKSGRYVSEYEKMNIKLIGLPFEVGEIKVNNISVILNDVSRNKDNLSFRVNKNFTEIHIIEKSKK